jgi:hypothetical protein
MRKGTQEISDELAQLMSESIDAGYKFFTPATMSFFDSIVHGDLHEGFFITSEQNNSVWGGERRFTIRHAESPKDICTASEFGEFSTYEEALEALTKSGEYL